MVSNLLLLASNLLAMASHLLLLPCSKLASPLLGLFGIEIGNLQNLNWEFTVLFSNKP